jgi:hypothetical protein
MNIRSCAWAFSIYIEEGKHRMGFLMCSGFKLGLTTLFNPPSVTTSSSYYHDVLAADIPLVVRFLVSCTVVYSCADSWTLTDPTHAARNFFVVPSLVL